MSGWGSVRMPSESEDATFAAVHVTNTAADTPQASPVIDVVLPVFNEQVVLRASVTSLHQYLSDQFPYSWRITIVDNASTDDTWVVAEELSVDLSGVRTIRIDRKGRGLALRTAWDRSDARIVVYMDVDLSTRLNALLPLVAPLITGHSDVAIGSRLAPGARVARGPRREFISRLYNRLLRTIFATRVHDAQCGFKAGRSDVVKRLLPAIHDDGWFFDTELLLLAEHNGLRIYEVPVDWVDDVDSSVRIVRTATTDLAGIVRMMWTFLRGRGTVDLGTSQRRPLTEDFGRRFVTFATIGSISTLVSLLVFVAFHEALGKLGANVIALAATFAANAWANARFTANQRRIRWKRALTVWFASLTVSSLALTLCIVLDAALSVTILVLVGSWLFASIFRLVSVDGWSSFGESPTSGSQGMNV